MENDLLKCAVLAALAFLFYAAIARGLFRATEPLRYAALDLAEQLTASDQVSDFMKFSIQRRLDEMHSAKKAWKIAWYAVLTTFCAPLTREEENGATDGIPPHLLNDFNRFGVYWVIATTANSPIAALLTTTMVALRAAASASASATMSAVGRMHDHHYGKIAH